ncbi:hypothetical protein Tco_0309939 [Tanacetum coccineum]
MMMENKRCGEWMIDNRWMDKRLKEVLMIDELSIVETDKVNHIMKTDMVKLMIEIECFGMSFDEFDKETGSSDGMQPNCVQILNQFDIYHKFAPLRRKSIQKLGVHLKLF